MKIPLRARVSQEVNNRVMDDLTTLQETTPVRPLLEKVTSRVSKNGRRFRGLDPVGKDRDLLLALSEPAFMLSGLTNKILRTQLADTPFGKGRTSKQLSARVSRHLLLLRRHGIIRKLPGQNKYQVTITGRRLVNALQGILAAFTENLIKNAA